MTESRVTMSLNLPQPHWVQRTYAYQDCLCPGWYPFFLKEYPWLAPPHAILNAALPHGWAVVDGVHLTCLHRLKS